MNWFRRHIRTGSRLALFALAIQFVLAFGHTHPLHAEATAPASLSSIELVAAAIDAETGFTLASQQPIDDHDRQPHHPLTDGCAICATVSMTATALFSASPILHLPEAFDFIYRITDAGFAHLDPSHAAFQPRGPPVS